MMRAEAIIMYQNDSLLVWLRGQVIDGVGGQGGVESCSYRKDEFIQ